MTSYNSLQSIIRSRIEQISENNNVFWLCGDQIARSRYDAMCKLSAGLPTRFYFYEKEWAAADWTKPTSVSFDTLMRNRAKEIREKNDFVRISYSGGADSHTVLTAFRDAGVAPDEISFWTMLGEYKTIFNSNFEINRSVIPYLDVIQSWFPKAKIKHINVDYARFKALKMLKPDHAFFEIATGVRSFTTAASIATFDDFDIGPNTITISGGDKPRLDYINGNWYAWMTDIGSMHSWGNTVDAFFQSSDPTIYIKQCHAMKDYLLAKVPSLNRAEILKAQNSSKISDREDINNVLGRSAPFNTIAQSRKNTRLQPGLGENGIKSYCMWRTIRSLPDGHETLKQWEETKLSFLKDTGYCPTTGLFGKFYNLDTGKIYTVDELFPNGWNIE